MASFYSDDETESFAGRNGQMMFNPSVYRKNRALRASQACVCISDCSGCEGTCCPGCYPVFKNTQDDHIGKYGCLGPDYDADGPFFEEPKDDELESESDFEKYNDELYARYCGSASQDELGSEADVDVLITANPQTLENKPNGKISVKVNASYNKNTPSDYEIDSILDFINNEELREKILNTKITTYEEIN